MITSGAFDYVNLLDKAADASAKRSTILANNLANADTPNYKRKDIDFSKTLMDEVTKLAAQNAEEEDEKVYFPRTYGLQYGVKYGSVPNYADVPEGFLSNGELIPEVDEDNVGNLVKDINLDNLRPKIYTEYEGLSYRIDKNNVDPDTENVELASEQIKYQVLTSSLTQDFQQMKSVLQ
ncbi:MAG: hypothetical protein IJ682_08545 [Lachnospiraceae bacterium]|nr:hypothetical protein [Lachnospiraceae bacterium]